MNDKRKQQTKQLSLDLESSPKNNELRGCSLTNIITFPVHKKVDEFRERVINDLIRTRIIIK